MTEDTLRVESTGETVGEAKWAALRELEKLHPELDKSAVQFQVVSEGERGLLGVGYAPARVIASVESSAVAEPSHSETELAARVREILERITGGLGLRCRIEIAEEDESLVATLSGSNLVAPPRNVDAVATLDVRLAEAERVIADAQLRQARAEGRLDPSVGVGMRQLRETGDRALIASLSVPLPVFDRNQGNVAAARSGIQSAEARRNSVLANTQAEIANARSALAAAEARVTALEGSGIGQAREALRLAQLSYRAGKSSLIELLDAQQAYASAQAELIAARRARAEAQATLARQAAASEVDMDQ